MKDHKHGVSTEEADKLLEVLRACAWAPPAEEDEKLPFDHHYKTAVSKLKESDAWIDNPQVKAWLLSKWLSNPKVMLIPVYTYTLLHYTCKHHPDIHIIVLYIYKFPINKPQCT